MADKKQIRVLHMGSGEALHKTAGSLHALEKGIIYVSLKLLGRNQRYGSVLNFHQLLNSSNDF